jgi:hypothetical protein
MDAGTVRGVSLYVLVNEQGPRWDASLPMREQKGWSEHARFMDALVDDRIVVLGGPLRGGPSHRALLVLRAPDVSQLKARLAEDPWMRSGILRMGELIPWELLLGELP